MTKDEALANYEILKAAVARDARIEFLDNCVDFEDYCEPKMRARLVALAVDDMLDEPHNWVWRLVVDYSEFDEYNKTLESANYYDKNNVPRLTAREARLYKAVDTLYVTPDVLGDRIKVLDQEAENSYHTASSLYARSKNDKETYVAWLERKVVEQDKVIRALDKHATL